MGPHISHPKETDEVIEGKLTRSKHISSMRRRRKHLYTGMIKRVLSSQNSKSSLSLLSLPEIAFFRILQYLSGDLRTILALSASLHVKVMEAMDHAFNSVESQFALVHSHLLVFKKSYHDITNIAVAERKGIRVDRIIVAELLPILINHTIKLRYTYKLYSSDYVYKSEFKFDCIHKGKRKLWAHRDECKFNGEDVRRAFTQQIAAVCIGDNIEIAINWFNLMGLIKLESIHWQAPIIQNTNEILKSLQLEPDFPKTPQDDSDGIKKKLYLYNVSRHCELELSQTEWYDGEYYGKPNQVYIYDYFYPFLKLVRSEFAGVDVTVSRNTYKAEKAGIVPDSVSRIGIQIEIKKPGVEVVTEVKRMGFVYDRHKALELRLGDTFVLYISRGG